MSDTIPIPPEPWVVTTTDSETKLFPAATMGALDDRYPAAADLATLEGTVTEQGADINGLQTDVTALETLTTDGRLSEDQLSATYVAWVDGQIEVNGGFTKPYDTDVWIAGPVRTDPTENSQGLYIQHRVAGNLGGLVNDAGASELRLQGVSNTGAGQSAHENSLVVTGGVNDAYLLIGSLANFHATGTPSGNIDEVDLFRASQIPTLPGTLTIDRAVSLHLDPQVVGAQNFTLYAPDGISVLGRIDAKDASTVGLRVRGVASQSAAILSAENSSATSLFSVQANGQVGVGTPVSSSLLTANNGSATSTTVALTLKAHASQSVDIFRVTDSADAKKVGVSSAGNLMVYGTSLIVRNSGDSGSFFSIGTTGPRWNDSGLAQTTVGAAGGASALPATPTKYFKVQDSAGTTLVIPAYAAS